MTQLLSIVAAWAFGRSNQVGGIQRGQAQIVKKEKKHYQGLPEDLTPIAGKVGREEAIKKVIGYTSTYIELNQYMQQAVELVQGGCIWSKDLYVDGQKNSNPCKDAVNAWEKAIATWSGSIEGEYGRNLREPGETGKFLEALAEKRCVNFKTCGVSSKDSTNKGVTPRANMGITASFEKGRAAIFFGKIGEAKRIISEINKELTISRIQGVMRYAYRMGQGSKKDKEIAEGAAFALGVLPQIYACNKKSAEIIAQNMQIGGDFSTQSNGKSVNFANVRAAFECNYPCLGIPFSDVGSLNDCTAENGDKTNCFTAKKIREISAKVRFLKSLKRNAKESHPTTSRIKHLRKPDLEGFLKAILIYRVFIPCCVHCSLRIYLIYLKTYHMSVFTLCSGKKHGL